MPKAAKGVHDGSVPRIPPITPPKRSMKKVARADIRAATMLVATNLRKKKPNAESSEELASAFDGSSEATGAHWG